MSVCSYRNVLETVRITNGLLAAQERADADALNEIAFDADEGRVLVTGKLWPRHFEVGLVPIG